MQAGTRDALSCMDRQQPTRPHGHVSGLLVKINMGHYFRRGPCLMDPIDYLDRKRGRAYNKRAIVTPGMSSRITELARVSLSIPINIVPIEETIPQFNVKSQSQTEPYPSCSWCMPSVPMSAVRLTIIPDVPPGGCPGRQRSTAATSGSRICLSNIIFIIVNMRRRSASSISTSISTTVMVWRTSSTSTSITSRRNNPITSISSIVSVCSGFSTSFFASSTILIIC